MAAFNRLSGADSDQITQDAQHTQAVDAQFIGAISKTKMLIDAFDGLKCAGNLIAPINCAREGGVADQHMGTSLRQCHIGVPGK